jgi:hypothetical protein
MVCIIDDREDVWNYARNLICVQPYVYFKNTGDINDPQAVSKAGSSNIRKRKLISNTDIKFQASSINSNFTDNNQILSTNAYTTSINKNNEDENSNNSENSKDSSSDTSSSSSISSSKDYKKNESISKEVKQSNNENKQLQNDDDPDNYLIYLQDILKKIHDEYYNIYDNRLKTQNRNLNSNEINESDLPDVKKVIPLIKSRILENVVITFSGVVPVGTSPQYDLKKQRCYLMAKSLGAKVNENLVLADENNDSESKNSKQDDNNENLISAESKFKVKKLNRRYQYSFDDEYISNSSGGEFRSEDEEYEVQYYINSESDQDQSGSKSILKNKKLVEKKLKRYTTHLVAAKHGTSKVHDALKSKLPIKVVTPEWLINCNFKWTHCNEDDFKLTKDYDYRTCIFHQEYNMHQKYSSNSKKSLYNSNNTKRSEFKFGLNSNKNDVSNFKTITNLKKNESTDSLSSLQVKTKKRKSNQDQSDNETTSSKSTLNINPINEDIFEMMDKEVNEELDDTDEDDGNDLTDDESDSNSTRSNCSTSSKSTNESGQDTKDQYSKINYNLSDDSNSVQLKPGPSSVSSTSSNDSSINSIDDEFGLELEKDLKKQD